MATQVQVEISEQKVTTPVAARAQRQKKRGLFRIGEEISREAYFLIALISFAIPLTAWCLFSYHYEHSHNSQMSLILPTPSAVFKALISQYQAGTLMPDIKISCFRIGMGFLISALLAIPLGILMGAYKCVEAANEPLVGFIRYIPVPALTALVIFTAGIQEPAKILIIFIGTYFQMVLIVADVTRQVPKDLLNAARTLGANKFQLLFNVLLPATLPGILDTCRIMLGWAWTYLVIAEVVASDSGLGFSLLKAQRFLRSDDLWVGILVLGMLGLISDMVFKILQPRLLPWAEMQKN